MVLCNYDNVNSNRSTQNAFSGLQSILYMFGCLMLTMMVNYTAKILNLILLLADLWCDVNENLCPNAEDRHCFNYPIHVNIQYTI